MSEERGGHHPGASLREYNDEEERIIILKIGGSSITNKAKEETLNEEALDWFAKLVAESVDPSYLAGDCDCASGPESRERKRPSKKFIVVHGAGSFGHHSAKRYGLRCGKAAFVEESEGCHHTAKKHRSEESGDSRRRHQMEGLSKTRASVQRLNAAAVGCLIKRGVNAVGISPGMSISRLHAHGATCLPKGVAPSAHADDESPRGVSDLCDSIDRALEAGLVPVVHGDACLLYDGARAGILGGDTIAEGIATMWDRDGSRKSRISEVVFITDVAGVFSSDPKSDDGAELIRSLMVDEDTGEVSIDDNGDESESGKEKIDVGGSSHAHDVTGGLKAKLGAAVAIVQAGIPVVVSQCGSDSTEKFVRGDWESIWEVEAGTLLSLRKS